MRVIPYAKQDIQQDDIDSVLKTLRSDYLTQGPEVEAFEKEFAQYVGSKYAYAVNNGTAALHLAATALGVKSGDKILCVANTFVASANCILYCGADVEFIDIDPKTYCIDIEILNNKLANAAPGTYKGVIVVDFAGYGLPLDRITQITKKYGLWVIEDACHAPGAAFEDASGKLIRNGSGRYADISIFSFHPVKHIATGEGGMITTNSDDAAQKIKLYRSHGITREPCLFQNPPHGGWYYEMQELGFNYRMPDILCALGRTQLAKLDKSIQRRNEIANAYDKGLAGLPLIRPYRPSKGMLHAFHLYAIQTEKRVALYNFLREHSIYSQVHYIPVHQQPFYIKKYGKISLPVTEAYYERALSLPMYPSLQDAEVEYVIEKIREFYARQ